MQNEPLDPVPSSSPGAPLNDGAELIGESDVLAAEPSTDVGTPAEDKPKVSAGYIWLLLFAVFGNLMAVVAPVGISLSLRVQELAPQNVEVLGYVVSAGSIVAAASTPLFGMWSDRTYSRFGRRKPFTVGGAIVGFIGLTLMAIAPDILSLAAAWMLTQAGWSAVGCSLTLSQADRLPESQRGKVAGLSGFVTMFGSVIGVAIASVFIGQNFLVFLVPGGIGLIAAVLFVLLVKEPDARDLPRSPRLSVGGTLANLVFNPRKYPDFAWNTLARFCFSLGVGFSTTFATLFFASRLSPTGLVADLGGSIIIISLLISVVAAAGGALFSGFLSDRLKRRRIFVLVSASFFTVGALVMAFGGSDIVILIAGYSLLSVGLGSFSAVDQAIFLDILPERDTQAGRFVGINNYTGAAAGALAPLVAAPLLLIGAADGVRNYALLFVIGGVLTLVAGLVVHFKVRGSN